MSESKIRFDQLGLPAHILTQLDTLGFTIPTPIQQGAIPPVLEGRDVIGLAQTGTGKTLAFGLPILARLNESKHGRLLVLAPTRELAAQILEALTPFLGAHRSALLIGGASIRPQVEALRRNPRVIVATPGRLLDHLSTNVLRLDAVSAVVLDEADRMLDMGFAPAINRILERCPTNRQTLLFSATMPKEIRALSNNYMRDAVEVAIKTNTATAELIKQSVITVDQPDKIALIRQTVERRSGSILIFTRTKHGARKLARALGGVENRVAEIHADRTMPQRRSAMDAFKSGQARILVATDIAARGIDVKRIELVVNFDVPNAPEDYVHRIGRTGRAGEVGEAITFVTPEQNDEIRRIERLIGQRLPRRGPNNEVTSRSDESRVPVVVAHTPHAPHSSSGSGSASPRRAPLGTKRPPFATTQALRNRANR